MTKTGKKMGAPITVKNIVYRGKPYPDAPTAAREECVTDKAVRKYVSRRKHLADPHEHLPCATLYDIVYRGKPYETVRLACEAEGVSRQAVHSQLKRDAERVAKQGASK